MYLDNAVVFGLGALGLTMAFMAGWIVFVVRDARRKKS
ncbi:cytochrome c oxidase subunit CcoM [Halomonas sp. V046]